MKRTTLALSLAALLLFGAVGCGDDEKADDTTALESDGDKSSDSSSDDTTDETKDDKSSDSSDSTDSTDDVPDLGDMGDLGDCMTIGLTYAGLALAALGGEDAAEEALADLEDMKTQLPSELEDDIEVIADAYGVLAVEGFIDGAEALETDEYKEADANIQAYIEEKCGS